MPVAAAPQKKSKKAQLAQLVQPVLMPIIKKTLVKKVEADVEAGPQVVNGGFDYELTDPLFDEDISTEELSSTGVTTVKNSMI